MTKFSNVAQVFHHHYPNSIQLHPQRPEGFMEPISSLVDGFSKGAPVGFKRVFYEQPKKMSSKLVPGKFRPERKETLQLLNTPQKAEQLINALHEAEKKFHVCIRPSIFIHVHPLDLTRSVSVRLTEHEIQIGWGIFKRVLAPGEKKAQDVLNFVHAKLNQPTSSENIK